MGSKVLLNPGPTNTSFITKIAQWVGTDVCHRTDDFFKLLEETRGLLLSRFSTTASPEEWNVSILAGSGTTAMEAMISSLISEKDNRVINAGAYGQRALDIMDTYEIEYDEIKSDSINDVERSDFAGNLYFVETETSTGEEYRTQEILRRYPQARFYIDATAAFGASNYDAALDNIDALSFCANKCLQSTAGLGLVLWRKTRPTHPRTYSLDLGRYVAPAIPFTLPTQSVSALREALSYEKEWQFNENETKMVFDRRRNDLLQALANIGIKQISKSPANSVIAFIHPTMDYEELRRFLDDRGIVIYSGIPDIDRSFRISTMSVLFERKFKKIVKTFQKSVEVK